MNEDNVTYLKNGLLYTGFGEKLNDSLVKSIQEQGKEFQLATTLDYKHGDKTEKVDFKLDFRKADEADMYFFNRYHATLKGDDPSKDKSHTFYINKDYTITAKEAYNLLSGRAVNKDMVNKEKEPYNAWMQLDFTKLDENKHFEMKKFSKGYGFDLEAVVNRYPIKELEVNETRAKLLTSLQKGNLHGVTFVKEGKEEKVHIAANPQYKTLYLYDASMKKIFQGNEKKEQPDGKAASQSTTEEKKEKKETKSKASDEEGPAAKSNKKKGVRV